MANENKRKPALNWGGIIGGSLAGLAIIYLLLAAFGVTGDMFGLDARSAGWAWKVAMLVPLALCAYMAYNLVTGTIEVNLGRVLLMGVFFALALGLSTGFKFTAGDIKQTQTFMTLDGKCTDVEGYIEAYGGWHGFAKDTATANYLREYQELPGVNHNAWNIRAGKTEPSKAPRAYEDYAWPPATGYDKQRDAIKEQFDAEAGTDTVKVGQ